MIQTKKSMENEKQLAVDSIELQKMLGCGRMTACQIGENAKAKIKIGRRTLWNVQKIEDFLNKSCV